MRPLSLTSTFTGTGNFTVAEAVDDILLVNDVFKVVIDCFDTDQWEFVEVTYLGAKTFSRGTVYDSSNNDTQLVDFIAGVKKIGSDLPPEILIRYQANVFITNNTIAVVNVVANLVTVGSLVVNATHYAAGANVTLGMTTLRLGNSTVNSIANSVVVKLSNSTVNTSLSVPTSAQWNGSYYLHANGAWATLAGAAGSAGGANTQVQFNDSTSIGGSTGFTFDKATNSAVIANSLSVSSNIATNNALIANVLSVGANVVVNTTVLSVGANAFINTTAIKVPNTGLITASVGAANGYTYLTGGVLMQWGWVAANATTGNITFPIAFPTAIYSYQATSNSTAAANLVGIIASNTTTMNVRSLSTAAASNSYWLAIGA
jgi:hypothetical protein